MAGGICRSPRDGSRDGPRDGTRDGAWDSPRDGPRGGSRDGPRDGSRDGPREGSPPEPSQGPLRIPPGLSQGSPRVPAGSPQGPPRVPPGSPQGPPTHYSPVALYFGSLRLEYIYIYIYIFICRPSHYIQVPFDSSFVCEITSTGKNARNAGRDVGFVRDRHPEVSQKLSHFLPPGQTRFIQLELCPEDCISIRMIL